MKNSDNCAKVVSGPNKGQDRSQGQTGNDFNPKPKESPKHGDGDLKRVLGGI